MQPSYEIKPEVRWGDWYNEGWYMFASQWQTWVLHSLVSLLILGVPLIILYALMIVPIIAAGSNPNPELPPSFFIVLLLIYGWAIIGGSIISAGTWYTAVKQLRGEKISVGDMFGGLSFVPRMLGATLLLGILSIIGVMLCILPGLAVIGLFIFTFPLMIERNLGVIEAMQTSFGLTKKNLLMFALFGFVTYLVGSMGAYACYIGLLATYPLMFCIFTIAYRDSFGVRGAARFSAQASGPQQVAAPGYYPPPPSMSVPPPPVQNVTAVCPRCGFQNIDNVRFCIRCGTPLQG